GSRHEAAAERPALSSALEIDAGAARGGVAAMRGRKVRDVGYSLLGAGTRIRDGGCSMVEAECRLRDSTDPTFRYPALSIRHLALLPSVLDPRRIVMKHVWILISVLITVAAAAAAIGSPEDEQAIRRAIASYGTTENRTDPNAAGAAWTESAVYVTET